MVIDEVSIQKVFGCLQKVFTESRITYQILSRSIFNMDVIGFMFGMGGSQRVIVPGGNAANLSMT